MFNAYIAYIKDNPQRYWFKRKLYGWGWTPATREGWMVTGAYVALIVLLACTLDETSLLREALFMFFLPVFILTATFIRIAYKKGEPPRWQWGIPKK